MNELPDNLPRHTATGGPGGPQQAELLALIKSQEWFYEFRLPDGSTSKCYLPEHIRGIHRTREKALRWFLGLREQGHGGGRVPGQRALDISCHEGFFSHLLCEHFDTVSAIDKNAGSLAKARLMATCLGKDRISFTHSDVESWHDDEPADFTLCFGLIYHVENPVQILRKLAGITKGMVCIESQVLPASLRMRIEDGSHLGQRETKGIFGLCLDYPTRAEGGLTELALVPSTDAIVSLLEFVGFANIQFYQPEPGDYEQFVRGHRVILCADKIPTHGR